MKKRYLSVILSFLMFFALLPFGVEAKSPKLWINGSYVETDVAPIVENNRTLVPLRVISETLSYKVTWYQETKAIQIDGPTTNVFFIDTPKALRLTPELTTKMLDAIKSGTPTLQAIEEYGSKRVTWDLDVAPKAVNNRTLVPIRAVSELLGNNVDWDQENYTVVIGDGYVAPKPVNNSNNNEAVTVERVIDGDTIVVSGGRKVRMILVDTPETKHPKKGVEYFGREASAYTTRMLTGKTVYLQKDVSETDKYGRLLRYVWLSRPSSNEPSDDEVAKLCFNSILLENGYGKLATFPPDVKYADFFRTRQQIAVNNNYGLWGNGGATPVKPVEKPQPKKPVAKPKQQVKTKVYNTNPLSSSYIGNSNTGKFHKRGCSSVRRMSPGNMVGFSSRGAAIGQGYSPCGRCHP